MTLLKKNMQFLANYLNEIDDLETRLQLATEVGVFDVGIESLKLLRDRERLSVYINQIPSKRHPHFRPKIEATLKNSVSKDQYYITYNNYSTIHCSLFQQIRWK